MGTDVETDMGTDVRTAAFSPQTDVETDMGQM